MKRAFLAGLASALICVLLPAAVGWLLPAEGRPLPAKEAKPAAQEIPTETSSAPEPVDRPADGEGFDAGFCLPVLAGDRVRSMDLQTYLTGVLLAELPGDFEPEAKKAQAAASRTYALRRYGNRRHGAAAVCTDPGCCQGWIDPETADPALVRAARQAVRETDGMVIRYEGELIDATFFSCSGGRTESAAAVWGSDLPYLRAVESPGEEAAAHDRDRTAVPLEDFRAAILTQAPEADLSGPPSAWLGETVLTSGGGVDTITIGGAALTGRALRRLFSLWSTAFSLSLTEAEAVFETRGFGHRVGLSQYGANAMALDGNTWEQILAWYYQGVEIGPYEP